MNELESCQVPRNLGGEDPVLHVGSHGFSWRQLAYVSGSTIVAYDGLQHAALPTPWLLGAVTTVAGMGFALATVRVRGYRVDELLYELLRYLHRQWQHHRLQGRGREHGPTVKIRATPVA